MVSITTLKKDILNIPLVVDLDGSLIKTELPWESFLYVLKKHPIKLLKIFYKKLKIKKSCYIKIELQKISKLFLTELPFSNNFLKYLKQEKSLGRKLILCTGSTQKYAEEIQKITNLFDFTFGSVLGTNLVGKVKADFLLKKYGYKKFDYAGNSLADFKVAKYARKFIMVNPSFLVKLFSKKYNISRHFNEKHLKFSVFANTVGLTLWFFNCIIFIPIAFIFFSKSMFLFLTLAVISFNCLVTGIYIFFKMLNISQDRKNLTKKSNNPFSTGDLSCFTGFYLCILFFVLGIYIFYSNLG